MARRAGLLRNRLNEGTLLSWAQTKESLRTADSSSPVIAVMQPAHALLADHCTLFQRACPCGSSKLSASEFSMQEASPWTAALRMARSSTAVHRCQLVELSLVYQDPGVNLPPNPDSDRIWFGIGNC